MSSAAQPPRRPPSQPPEQSSSQPSSPSPSPPGVAVGRRAGGGLARPLLIALVVALAGAGVLFLADGRRDTSPAANRALLDAQATTEVIGDVSAALVKIFSYAPGDTAATERAAAEVLDGTAAAQYRALFTQVKRQAPAQRLSLTTRVVRAGVDRLSGGTAHLVVFLDQVSTRDGKAAGGTASAQLAVTARLHGDQWRITAIRAI